MQACACAICKAFSLRDMFASRTRYAPKAQGSAHPSTAGGVLPISRGAKKPAQTEKKRSVSERFFHRSTLFSGRSFAAAGSIARIAINGNVLLRLELAFEVSAALVANGVIHGTVAADGVLAGLTACLAAGGLVFETLLRIKLLFACRESEFRAAVLANQYFVFEHDGNNPLNFYLADNG
jgi:hypothetical protein